MFLLIELISSLIARFSRDDAAIAPSRVTGKIEPTLS